MRIPSLVLLLAASCATAQPAPLPAEPPPAPPASAEATPAEEAPVADAPRPTLRHYIDPDARALAEKLDTLFTAQPERRVVIQLDKPLYRPGETVWFKTWDLDLRDLSGDAEVRGVWVELLGPRGQVVERKHVEAERGMATNDFVLPGAALGGVWQLRATTYDGLKQTRELVVASYEAPRIRKELDFVREAYGPGDEVSALITVEAQAGGPLGGEALFADVRVDGQKLERLQVTTDGAGEALVRFRLPDTLEDGHGVLTVLVDDGGVTESISRAIPIVMERIEVDWRPEGGDLVEGLESRVYFAATDAHGEPADVAGRVLDDSGAVVATFESVHDGLGRFTFTPRAGRSYHAELDAPAGIDGRYRLPEAVANGCVLRTLDDLKGEHETLRAQVWCSQRQDILVVGTLRGQVLDAASVVAGPQKPAVVWLKPDDRSLARTQGVARVTALTEDLEPLAERLVYRNLGRDLDIQVEADRARYGPRDKVTLRVTTRDADGRPVPAELALSVVDDTVLSYADDERASLMAALFLEPDLPVEVHDPDFYFDPEEEDRALAMEMLMGARGWRRFDWVRMEPEALAAAEAEAMDDAQVQELAGQLGAFTPPADLTGGIGGLIGAKGGQFGSGGLGSRGSGLGGGGTAEGLGGLGTKGVGSGASGYGAGGNIGAKGVGAVGRVGGEPIILGAVDKTAIEAVIRRHLNQIRYCYQRELTKDPDLGGKLVIKFLIAPDGTVASAEPKSSTLDNRAVEDCVAGRFMRFQFPEPKGGGIVIVAYPFIFAPEEGAGQPGNDGPYVPPERSLYTSYVAQRPVPFSPVRVFPAPEHTDDGVRGDFRDTVLWAPRVTTDAQGEAELELTLSDAVTTFRVTAEGVGAGLAGHAEAEIVSELPFAMDLRLPLEVSAGDRLLLPLSLDNNRDEAVAVDLTAAFGALLRATKDVPERLTLSAGEERSIFLPMEVEQAQGQSALRFEAETAGLRDAVTREVRVVGRGFPRALSEGGRLDDRAEHAVALGEVMPGSVEARVRFYPNPLADLAAGLEGMLQEPHGCFEQTSSGNYPNTMVLSYLDSVGMESPGLRATANRLLAKGYERLVGFESVGGGFEWYGRSPAHPELTAYGLQQFVDMSKVWSGVDDALIRRTRQWLLDRRDGRGGYKRGGQALDQFGKSPDEVRDAYITWSLVYAGETALGTELAAQQQRARTSQDPYVTAIAALTLLESPAWREEGVAAARRLAEMQSGSGLWEGAGASITRSYGADLVTETTALATMALLKAGVSPAGVERGVDALLQRRRNGRFGATQATVLTLRTLVAWSADTASRTDGQVAVKVDGQLLETLRYGPETLGAVESGDLSRWLAGGTHTVTLVHVGQRPVPYGVDVRWRTLTPANAKDARVTVDAELGAAELSLGESVDLRAEVVNTSSEPVPSAMVRLGFPAGLALETRQLEDMKDRGEIAAFETGPREAILYLDGLNADEVRVFTLNLDARIPGHSEGPPSSAWPYYQEESRWWDAGLAVAISP
ncbi:MAG: AgmX/PglI C-terminal domain-containing protein [Alphaproteobacteria bacterium]|nr:AgmX/PglI C-terminal domain-containing protein [Alphaproteobacteria bacterium]